MLEDIKINLDNEYIKFQDIYYYNIDKKKITYLIILSVIIIITSIVIFILQNFSYEPFEVLKKFKRIKKNINSWFMLSKEKTVIEKNKGEILYLTKPNLSDFNCIDFGNYYTLIRLNQYTKLPEFVKRGNSGPWIIKKADTTDVSAYQFCLFLKDKYTTVVSDENLIMCGDDMFNKLGFSGYFFYNSPCELAIDVMSNF